MASRSSGRRSGNSHHVSMYLQYDSEPLVEDWSGPTDDRTSSRWFDDLDRTMKLRRRSLPCSVHWVYRFLQRERRCIVHESRPVRWFFARAYLCAQWLWSPHSMGASRGWRRRRISVESMAHALPGLVWSTPRLDAESACPGDRDWCRWEHFYWQMLERWRSR